MVQTPPADLLPWDSEFFGLHIGKVRPGDFDPVAIHQWRIENDVHCLYYLAELTDTASIHAAEQAGFHLVDIRTTLLAPMPSQTNEFPPPEIRAGKASDLPLLQKIAHGTFTHSRFYHDPHFPVEKCDEMYAIWVEKQLMGEQAIVWVVEEDRDILGFVTVLDLNEKMSSISLIGIHSRARGRGLGHSLVNHARQERATNGFSEMEVVTQACNRAAMKLYQSCGFQVIHQQAWLHGWFE